MGKKVYIDYLGVGFDVGGITKGEDNHEMFGLKSFVVQGMIRGGELFPIEINRMERFIEKDVLLRNERDYEDR